MPTRIIETTDAIIVQFSWPEIVKSERIDAAMEAARDGFSKTAPGGKAVHFDLRQVATLSAAAIGQFVQVGRDALDGNVGVRFVIPPDLEGMFRILHLHNVFDVQVQMATVDDALDSPSAPASDAL